MIDRSDAKWLAAADELAPEIWATIRAALSAQHPWPQPARLDTKSHVRTSLGFVVHNGIITPLAVRIIEAVDWNAPVKVGEVLH